MFVNFWVFLFLHAHTLCSIFKIEFAISCSSGALGIDLQSILNIANIFFPY